MKIIATDNFARECVSDRLICDNINKTLAQTIVRNLNLLTEDENWYFKVVEDYFTLYEYKP